MGDYFTQDLSGFTSKSSSTFSAEMKNQWQLAYQGLYQDYKAGNIPVFAPPFWTEDLVELEDVAKRYRQDFEDILILGTGGSSLGGRALAALHENVFQRQGLRLHFLDNVDPFPFENLRESLDPLKTGVVVISKSGSTAETLCQFQTLWGIWRNAWGEAVDRHVTVITENPYSALGEIAKTLNLPVFMHPHDVGGRFSVFTLVGLLPALLSGVDVRAFRQGAVKTLDALFASSDVMPDDLHGVSFLYAFYQKEKRSNTVLMAYEDRLSAFGDWFCQLWAESLGKEGLGTTPLKAMGTRDQHSQLQLYLDGPQDKVFTLIHAATEGAGPRLPDTYLGIEGLDYFRASSMGDLLVAEQKATAETLIRKGCPTRVLRLQRRLDEATLGALMAHFMVETLMMARLLNVNAFDQPAVEESKVLTREYMRSR